MEKGIVDELFQLGYFFQGEFEGVVETFLPFFSSASSFIWACRFHCGQKGGSKTKVGLRGKGMTRLRKPTGCFTTLRPTKKKLKIASLFLHPQSSFHPTSILFPSHFHPLLIPLSSHLGAADSTPRQSSVQGLGLAHLNQTRRRVDNQVQFHLILNNNHPQV